MPVSLQNVIDEVRSILDEPSTATNKLWSDNELTRWINSGTRDIARRGEVLLEYYTSIPAIPNQTDYLLPTNIVRAHRLEYSPAGTSWVYNVQLSTYDEMDPIWGIYRNVSPATYPSFAVFRGTQGVALGEYMVIYPPTSQAGTFTLFYYRLPYRFDTTLPAGESAKFVEVPEGWDDLVATYAESRARRKDRDPLWKDVMDEYESKFVELVDKTRQAHDQPQFIVMNGGYTLPYQVIGDW